MQLSITPSISFARIATSKHHTIAVSTAGRTFVWGLALHGVLGLGTGEIRNTPTELTVLQHVRAVACSDTHSVVVTRDGDAYAWGTWKWCLLPSLSARPTITATVCT